MRFSFPWPTAGVTLRGTGLPAPIAWKPAERCSGANDVTNSGEREVVARDHRFLTRASLQEGSASLRALIQIQVKSDAPVRVLEGYSAVPNNVCRTEKLARTGRDLRRGVSGRVPGCGYRCDARDHLALWLHSPDAVLDRRERFHVLAINAAPTSMIFQRMLRLHPEVQFRFADHMLGVGKGPLGVS